MVYAVSLTARAEVDAYQAFEHMREVAPRHADEWLHGLIAAIKTLSEMPARCPVIPEAEEIRHPARHLIYGKRTAVYRIIFDVLEHSEEGPRVRVLRIWRGVRGNITPEDL